MSMMTKSALPMIMINWIFGMGIIEYPLGKEYRAISFLYSTVCIVGYCSLAASAYPHLLSMAKAFEAKPAMLKFFFYSNIFITIGTIVTGWKRSQGMRLMLLQIRNVDLLFENIGVVIKYSKRFKIQIGLYIARISFILILIVINALYLLSRDAVQNTEIAAIAMMSYPVVLVFIVDSTFINFVACAFCQFRKLNDTLRKMLTSSEDFPQHKRVITAYLESTISQIDKINSIEVDSTYKLNIARKAHLELVHFCKEADETFRLHILQSIIVSIIVTTGCLYQIYVLLPCAKIADFNFYQVVLHNGIWVFYYIIKIYIFSKGCSTVVQESTTTGDIISEFYDEPSSTEETRAVIREFHYHLIRNVISFDAYGFVKIDFSLIKVVLGSVTTYLMIFSQFKKFIMPDYNNSTCIRSAGN